MMLMIIKKILQIVLILSTSFSIGFGFIPVSYAQTPVATPAATPVSTETPPPVQPAVTGPTNVADVTFAQVDQPAVELRSPISQESVVFEIPDRWNIVGQQSYLELHYDLTKSIIDNADLVPYDVTVDVYINDVLAYSFSPIEGPNQKIQIPFPEIVFANPDRKQLTITLFFLAGDCDLYNEHSILTVYDDSLLHLVYTKDPLEINLANFPAPLVQNLFEPETVLIIIPDQYTDSDLSSAATIAASLGLRTFGEVNTNIVPASDATAEMLANRSAIIVGQPNDNALLRRLYQDNLLPTTLEDNGQLIVGPANQPISSEDGILQEIVSIFDSEQVFLVVTGLNDTAIAQAAQALSVISPRYGFDGNLIVVSKFEQLLEQQEQTQDTYLLSDFGFSDVVLYGITPRDRGFAEGLRTSVDFFVPATWRFTDTPTLDLSYFYSSALSSYGSGVQVNLNGKPIGSAPVGGDGLGQNLVRFELPISDLEPGARNRLEFSVMMNMDLPNCVLPQIDLAWTRINANSLLNLPHIVTDPVNVVPTLSNAFNNFVITRDLRDVLIAMPENTSQTELTGLANISAWLGNISNGVGFQPMVARSMPITPNTLAKYNIISVGLPTQNTVLAAINDYLPQSFIPGEDSLRQEVGNVVFRLPADFSVGLLQALPSPWDVTKNVLAITGTNPNGIEWALHTLTDPQLYYELDGDLAYVKSDRFETYQSTSYLSSPLVEATKLITSTGPGILEPVEPVPTPNPVAIAGSLPAGNTDSVGTFADSLQAYLPQDHSMPASVFQLSIGVIVAGLLIAVVGILFSWRKAKR